MSAQEHGDMKDREGVTEVMEGKVLEGRGLSRWVSKEV